MKVITVATQKSGYFNSLEESAHRLAYEFVVLGFGETWKGFGWRTRLLINYLKTLPLDELFIAVDAYDVILLRDSTAAKDGFEKTGARFLCGGFRKFEGLVGVIQDQEFGSSTSNFYLPGPYTSICAGTWMSTPRAVLELWDTPDHLGSLPDNGDDQRLLNRMFDELGPYCVTPDINFNVFMTLFPYVSTRKLRMLDDIRVSDHNTLISGITNTEPILLHALCNADIHELLETLHFKNTNDLTSNQYIMKKYFYHAKSMLRHSWVARLFIILLLLMGFLSAHLLKKFFYYLYKKQKKDTVSSDWVE